MDLSSHMLLVVRTVVVGRTVLVSMITLGCQTVRPYRTPTVSRTNITGKNFILPKIDVVARTVILALDYDIYKLWLFC